MSRPGVAAFDFDGTLARRDTLVPFLRQVRGTTGSRPPPAWRRWVPPAASATC